MLSGYLVLLMTADSFFLNISESPNHPFHCGYFKEPMILVKEFTQKIYFQFFLEW